MGVQPIRKTVVPEIPDKLYFRIGDVARLCEVPAYVLRFWETEFPQLKPNKGGTGQRLYRKRDVETALRIKSLLYDQGYTIPGARQVFKTETKTEIRVRETAAEPSGESGESGVAEAVAPATVTAPAIAARAFASALPVAPPSSDYDAGAEVRRQVKLHALRTELQAVLDLLNRPLRQAMSAAPAAQPQPMRSRLALEPRPAAAKPEPARGETLRLVSCNLRDLPPGE